MKVANGVYKEDMRLFDWTYVDGHTSGEALGKLTYMKLLSKSNGNFLVVPSSVNAVDGGVSPVGFGGFFWSSSLDSQYVVYAWYGYFYNGSYGVDYASLYRYGGFGVRGVVCQ